MLHDSVDVRVSGRVSSCRMSRTSCQHLDVMPNMLFMHVLDVPLWQRPLRQKDNCEQNVIQLGCLIYSRAMLPQKFRPCGKSSLTAMARLARRRSPAGFVREEGIFLPNVQQTQEEGFLRKDLAERRRGRLWRVSIPSSETPK